MAILGKMEINISYRNNDMAILKIKNNFTFLDKEYFEETIKSVLEKGNYNILLNFEGVSYICSSGIGTIIFYYETLKKKGRQLKICNAADPHLATLFSVMQFDRTFKEYDQSEAAVLKTFNKRQI